MKKLFDTNYSPEQFKEMVGNRKICIYGVNLEGNGFRRLLPTLGYPVLGYIDSRSFKNDQKLDKPVFHPMLFSDFANSKEHFVLIATKHRATRQEATKRLQSIGMEAGKDFINATDLCRYLPTIEVAGVCNLRCISCDVGVKGFKQGKLMSADDYREVLMKMKSEIPFMNSVCLYLWGEPLLNKEMAEIIKITHDAGLACEISTNLNYKKNIEETIEAGPDLLLVPCSGWGKNYEITHTGGRFNVFLDNLHRLSKAIEFYNAETSVRIVYHMYKHNLNEEYNQVEALAKELGFHFGPIIANIFPQKVYEYAVENKPLPEEMQKASKLTLIPLKEVLEKSLERKDKSCPVMMGFPTVRWDKSVQLCCNRVDPSIATNYMEHTLEDLNEKRDGHEVCTKCMDKGLHRFFDVNAKIQVVDGTRVADRI